MLGHEAVGVVEDPNGSEFEGAFADSDETIKTVVSFAE